MSAVSGNLPWIISGTGGSVDGRCLFGGFWCISVVNLLVSVSVISVCVRCFVDCEIIDGHLLIW